MTPEEQRRRNRLYNHRHAEKVQRQKAMESLRRAGIETEEDWRNFHAQILWEATLFPRRRLRKVKNWKNQLRMLEKGCEPLNEVEKRLLAQTKKDLQACLERIKREAETDWREVR